MTFRDDADALRIRIAELEAILAARETELDAVRNERPDVGRLRAEVVRLRETMSAVERRARRLRAFAITVSGLIVFALVVSVWLASVTAPFVRRVLDAARADDHHSR